MKLDAATWESIERDRNAMTQALTVVAIAAIAAGIGGIREEWIATPGELLRTLGFAQAPGVLSVFGLLGVFGAPIVLIGSIWGIVTAIVALKTSLEMSTGRAIAVGIIAGIASLILVALILLPFGIADWALS
ncbi:MAG TPA: hypothetical protein PKA95_08220 [Thermomicrobiales bacterium]|nr:hypothetical protein [Thermomicrobiales bacterium]